MIYIINNSSSLLKAKATVRPNLLFCFKYPYLRERDIWFSKIFFSGEKHPPKTTKTQLSLKGNVDLTIFYIFFFKLKKNPCIYMTEIYVYRDALFVGIYSIIELKVLTTRIAWKTITLLLFSFCGWPAELCELIIFKRTMRRIMVAARRWNINDQ